MYCDVTGSSLSFACFLILVVVGIQRNLSDRTCDVLVLDLNSVGGLKALGAQQTSENLETTRLVAVTCRAN